MEEDWVCFYEKEENWESWERKEKKKKRRVGEERENNDILMK
jgi:hypothetical protein